MDKGYFKTLIFAVFIFLIGESVNLFAGSFVDKHPSTPVNDLILDHLPLIDVNWFFTYGFILFVFLLVILSFIFYDKTPFALKAFGLLLFVRGISICLTHIGPYPVHINNSMDITFLHPFFSNADLFFSGHTAATFMAALLFMEKKVYKYGFLILSILMAVSALLLKVHYSIDILGAYFITYGIYRAARYIFRKDFIMSDRKPAGVS